MHVPRRPAAIYFRWFLLVWFFVTLPAISLLTVNSYSRFVCLEMFTHYAAKLLGLNAVFIGDSIMAGGRNWGWSLGCNPFSTRNLGCSGYTVHQVRALAKDALAYHPRWVIVMAGTNDLLDEAFNRDCMAFDYKLMLLALKEGKVKPVVTLTPHSARGDRMTEINLFNNEVLRICAAQSVPVIDLNPVIAPNGKLLPEFTTDGVHFSRAAYQLWISRLRQVLDH